MSQHIKYMQQAYELAKKGLGYTWPNPMVGAVIVKNGCILAQGWHKRCGGDHAEVDALRQVSSSVQGATLYVTLEPCSHWGRTGPCTEAIIKAGIKKVVIGVLDPNPVNHGKSVKILRKAGIEVEVGFLEQELTEMNKVFNKYITQQMPFVVAKCAQSLDGKIATVTGDSQWITSAQTRAYAHKRRYEFDAIMVGINTVLQDDPRLDPIPNTKALKKIVVDSLLRVPLKAKLFKDSTVIVATTSKASKKKIAELTNQGVMVWVAPAKGKHKQVNLKWLFKQLAKEKIAHVLIEGGGCLIGQALKDGLVDRMMIYMAPKIVGDQNAVSSIAGLNIARIDQAILLKSMSVKTIGEDILIEGDIDVYRNR